MYASSASVAFMFQASHCYTTCRETWKLEKSQIVLLFGNSPTRRMEHGLTQSPRMFMWVHYFSLFYSSLCASLMLLHLMGVYFFVFRIKHLKRFKTKKRKLMVQFQVKIETTFSRPHIKTLCSAIHRSLVGRSEERRVGKECTSWCRSRWSPYH